MDVLSLKEPVRITDLLDLAQAQWPDAPALTFNGITRNWKETVQRIRGMSFALKQLGVTPGDRVAFLGVNSHCIYESYWSPMLIGAIMVPVNYRLAVREMIECLEDSKPKVLFVDDGYVEQARTIQKACASIAHVIYAGDGQLPEGMLSYENEIIAAKECELTPSSGDDVALIFYTGGTTGRSKGVMLTNTNFYTNTVSSISMYRLKPGTSFLISGPLFHLAAGARVFSSAAVGGHTVILPKFDVPQVLRCVQVYKTNSMTLVPTMFQMILDHPDFSKYDLSSLEMIAYGAAPMPPALINRILEAFPDVDVFQTFGMTEAAPIVTTLDSKYHVTEGPNAGKLNSVGKAVPHVKLKIMGEDSQELGVGETGEILVQGRNIMRGYWQMPELSREALKGGWYHTGDAGYLDKDGFLFLEGRIKDMIVSGGENIYPIEVESVLTHHRAVSECAVIGIPHDTWGEAVHGIVTFKQSVTATEAELIAYCRERLAHYKCPVSLSVRQEPMPLSAVNKILKSELRKPFWQGKKSQLV